MNYLWEILLQAKEQGIETERLRFQAAKSYSPYVELSEEYLNLSSLEEPYLLELNPCYRFPSIFQGLFHPEVREYPQLREGLFQLLIHQLGENDIRMGMTREEYEKKLLVQDVEKGRFGEAEAKAYLLFSTEERKLLLEAILALYREGESLLLFRYVMCSLFSPCIVYESNHDPYQLLIYMGKKREPALEEKVNLVCSLFLGIRYHRELYYEYHFGIIGVEETMCIGEIAIG